jgi:hypothetical protein
VNAQSRIATTAPPTSVPLPTLRERWEHARQFYAESCRALDALGTDYEDAALDAAVDIMVAGFDPLMLTPAPGSAEVIEKLDLLRHRFGARHDCSLEIPNTVLAAIVDDIRRLAPPPADTARWDTALAEYQTATTAVEAIPDEDEDAQMNAVTIATRALEALIAIPAPDNAAFATKLRIIDDEGYQGEARVWGAVIADARRLGPTVSA